MAEKPLPYPLKPPSVADFPKEFAKAYAKEEVLSVGVSWDFPTPEKFPTPKKLVKRLQSYSTETEEGEEEHHPDFYNHTPIKYKS